jgi:probable rRNA maturation factor
VRIRVFYDDTDFRIKSWRRIRKLIEKVIAEEGKISGDLNFILTNDKTLKEINIEFLKHNYYTDVICFDCGEINIISGEIYISLDTVKINARNYKISYNTEIIRVMIHGVLHLCGYDDNEKRKKDEMRGREDYWLTIFDMI